MIGIVVSRADSASEHIFEQLLDLREWDRREDATRPDADGGGTYYRSGGLEVRTFDELHIYLEGIEEAFDDPEAIVFASRHSGDTGALLTAHHTGNFGPAKYGGEDGELACAAPNLAATAVDRLADYAPGGYDVGLECTHHGPTDLDIPSLFVELGSGEPQWEDPDAARAVARAILNLDGVPPHSDRQIVGFGGGHYAPRFTRIVRETDRAVGHIAADWCLDALGNLEDGMDVIRHVFERSNADRAVLDGTNPEVEAVVDELGYEIVSETWLTETVDVPTALVDRLEGALCSVDAGLRFGDPARAIEDDSVDAPRDSADDDPVETAGDSTDVVVASLPSELFEAAQGIDREATLAALERHCLAYETDEGGTRVGDRAAFLTAVLEDDGDRAGVLPDSILDELADILDDGYDAVSVDGDRIVAETTAFDPALAADLGVPEGPKFGSLAGGDSVVVDGETIDPDDVTRRRTDSFSIELSGVADASS